MCKPVGLAGLFNERKVMSAECCCGCGFSSSVLAVEMDYTKTEGLGGPVCGRSFESNRCEQSLTPQTPAGLIKTWPAPLTTVVSASAQQAYQRVLYYSTVSRKHQTRYRGTRHAEHPSFIFCLRSIGKRAAH